MAEIPIQRTAGRNVWPWVIGAVIVIALLWYLFGRQTGVTTTRTTTDTTVTITPAPAPAGTTPAGTTPAGTTPAARPNP
ncbi:MAG: dynamin [Gemmatimonadota bacterium]|nr:dynamin [Gemmatimonadota bacterium]